MNSDADQDHQCPCLITSIAPAVQDTPPRDGAPTFKVDPDWPKPLPDGRTLGPIMGLALDGSGCVWAMHFTGVPPAETAMPKFMGPHVDVDLPPVLQFDADGNIVRAWGGPGEGYDWPNLPHGLFVDHKGYIWIAGTNKGTEAVKGDGQVLKFNSDGEFVLQLGYPGGSGEALDHTSFDRPSNVYVDPFTDEVFVADGYGNRRIIVFDADSGSYKRMWGAYGNLPVNRQPDALNNFFMNDPFDPDAPPPVHFNSPVHCITMAKDRLLYVCDRSNSRIQVFQPDGRFVREFIYTDERAHGGTGQITDLTLWPDTDQTYMIGGSSSILVIRRCDGTVLARFGQAGDMLLHMLAMDRDGNLYTGEVNNRVRRWLPTFRPKCPSGEPRS